MQAVQESDKMKTDQEVRRAGHAALQLGSKVWVYSTHLRPPEQFEIVYENRQSWTVGCFGDCGEIRELHSRSKISKSYDRLFDVAHIAFSEEEMQRREWVRCNFERVLMKLKSGPVGYDALLDIGCILGYAPARAEFERAL